MGSHRFLYRNVSHTISQRWVLVSKSERLTRNYMISSLTKSESEFSNQPISHKGEKRKGSSVEFKRDVAKYAKEDSNNWVLFYNSPATIVENVTKK